MNTNQTDTINIATGIVNELEKNIFDEMKTISVITVHICLDTGMVLLIIRINFF